MDPLLQCIYNNKDYTTEMKQFYGSECNWNNKSYRYVDLFGSECTGHQFKITFQSGQKIHWLYGCILDKQQYFHPRKFDRDYTSTKL